jgi:SAM-dependent methyltransferase
VRERALQYLACPGCGGDFRLGIDRAEGDHVITGWLRCESCSTRYAIRGGVPRFAPEPGQVESRTAQAFGYEWLRYPELGARYRQQFLDWIRPVDAGFFRDRVVLEGGCGKGRHSRLAGEFGARDVVALDLSDAVDAAFANTRDMPNVHIVQGNMNLPPVKRAFDYAFSVGVLHHLPDPERGFHALVSRLKPGGSISAWVYGREGNGWIVHVVSPLREHVTSRLPHALLEPIATLLTVPLFLATRLLYAKLHGRASVRLPYGDYLAYIAPFPFREQRHIVFDHLVAPVAFYLRRDEFAGWFLRAGLEGVRIEHHNSNSWRGFASVPAAIAALR